MALHDPSQGIRVLSSEMIGQYKKKEKRYTLFNHKCSSCTSSAMERLESRWKGHTWLILHLCTSVQIGRAGRKTTSHYLLQLQNRQISLFYFYFYFFYDVWLALHVCFVNTGSVLPPTSRVRDYVMHEVKLVQDKNLCLRNIIFLFFWKWPIILLDKTHIYRLGSCRALWSCIETEISFKKKDFLFTNL